MSFPETICPDPLDQFNIWYCEVRSMNITAFDAMSLSTANASGVPSSRMVLLKGYDKNGFIFFTNYESGKGKDLDENPRACCVFYWKEIERQVRISGRVKKIPREDSEEYFRTRPYENRISAWASAQSSVIPDREHLIRRYDEFKKKFHDEDVPCPPQWGGYRIIPESVEFWQGQPGRLHDRIKYERSGDSWIVFRLAP